MQPRQQRGVQRRAALVRAAADLAVEQGFDAVSHRSVARRAGVPLGSTTYYFRSLDDLLGEVARDLVEQWLARGAQVAAEIDTAPLDAASTADALVRALMPSEDHTRVLCQYEQILGSARYPAVSSVLLDTRPRVDQMITTILAKAGYSGRISARLVLATIDGAVLHALSEGRNLVEFTAGVVTELLSSPGSAGDLRGE